jgi:hypothetical protein
MGRMSFTQELKALAKASEAIDAGGAGGGGLAARGALRGAAPGGRRRPLSRARPDPVISDDLRESAARLAGWFDRRHESRSISGASTSPFGVARKRSPTAMHAVAELQETRFSAPEDALGRIGVCSVDQAPGFSIDQRRPSQRSISGAAAAFEPTAVHALAEEHDTAVSDPTKLRSRESPGALSVVVVTDQRRPFHCSANGPA